MLNYKVNHKDVMGHPCLDCIVRAGCTEICISYAEFIYDNKDTFFYDVILPAIKSMNRKESIELILVAENISLQIARDNEGMDKPK